VGFDTDDDHLGPVDRKHRLAHAGVGPGAERGFLQYPGLTRDESFTDRRDRRTDALGVLFRGQNGQIEDSRAVEDFSRRGHDSIVMADERQEFLLHIDHQHHRAMDIQLFGSQQRDLLRRANERMGFYGIGVASAIRQTRREKAG
jgi:hypothetical protein